MSLLCLARKPDFFFSKKKKKKNYDDDDIEVDGLRLRRRAQSESSRYVTQEIEQMRQERARAEKMMQVRMHHFEIDRP